MSRNTWGANSPLVPIRPALPYCESKEYVFSDVEMYDSELSSLLRKFYAEAHTGYKDTIGRQVDESNYI